MLRQPGVCSGEISRSSSSLCVSPVNRDRGRSWTWSLKFFMGGLCMRLQLTLSKIVNNAAEAIRRNSDMVMRTQASVPRRASITVGVISNI
jgi:hypothetical protein